jgi:hypothetical protein
VPACGSSRSIGLVTGDAAPVQLLPEHSRGCQAELRRLRNTWTQILRLPLSYSGARLSRLVARRISIH